MGCQVGGSMFSCHYHGARAPISTSAKEFVAWLDGRFKPIRFTCTSCWKTVTAVPCSYPTSSAAGCGTRSASRRISSAACTRRIPRRRTRASSKTAPAPYGVVQTSGILTQLPFEVGKQAVKTGSVRVRKTVQEKVEHVDIPVLHDTVDAITRPLQVRALARIEKEDGRKFYYHRKNTLVQARATIESAVWSGQECARLCC